MSFTSCACNYLHSTTVYLTQRGDTTESQTTINYSTSKHKTALSRLAIVEHEHDDKRYHKPAGKSERIPYPRPLAPPPPSPLLQHCSLESLHLALQTSQSPLQTLQLSHAHSTGGKRFRSRSRNLQWWLTGRKTIKEKYRGTSE